MSDSQEEEMLELDQQEMQQCQKNTHNQSSKATLNTWVVYCKFRGKKSGNQQYSREMQTVGSFNTLNEFFKLHTGIREPSELDVDVKLMYFVKGCQPLWEKWQNSGALHFHVRYKDEKDKLGAKVLNKIWQYLLFCLIGNSLPNTDLKHHIRGKESIIGIVLGRRQKLNIIQLWFRSDKNALKLGREIEINVRKELVMIKEYQKSLIQVNYQLHKVSLNNSSTIKGSQNLKGLNSSY